MKHTGLVIMLIALFTLGNTFLAHGQVDGSSNGQPSAGNVDPAAVADLERASELLVEEGKERDALRIALPLVEKFEQNEDYDHLVDCVFLIGEAYYHLGEWENAEQFMQLAADLGYRYFSDQMSSYPLKVVGECQYELGKMEAALATFQERVSKIRRSDEDDQLAGALFDVASLQINLEQEQSALNTLSQALVANDEYYATLTAPGSEATADERNANRVDHAEITYHQAIANFRLDNQNAALDHLRDALAEYTSLPQAVQDDFSDRIVAVLTDLVAVCENLEMAEEAEQYRAERDKLNQ